MPVTRFAVTWDYRCPFARIAHDHVLTALDGGADWDVSYVPLSLSQLHVGEGEADVWDEPERDKGLLAMQAAVVVRDQFPERFRAVHRAFFDARHVSGQRIDDPAVVRSVLGDAGVDADAVLDAVTQGKALETVRAEHERTVSTDGTWGVPTFLVDDQAVFVRLMEGPAGDAELARRTVERVLDLVAGWPELNELKHTRIPR
jgi:hypothetical protein